MASIYRLEASIPWEICQDRESGAWIGVCRPLKLTALGETNADLHQSIAETMDALFRDLISDGVLDQFLRAHGWRFQGSPRLDLIDDETQFDIPIEMVKSQNPLAHACA